AKNSAPHYWGAEAEDSQHISLLCFLLVEMLNVKSLNNSDLAIAVFRSQVSDHNLGYAPWRGEASQRSPTSL
ncbi:MAG: hypothetical protein DME59_20000, partial [Verrucomicrobia bacterium]